MKQRVHVLIVDHEVHTRQGLQALLAAWPQIELVGAAANGVEAVGLIEKRRPDVALIDIPMPAAARSGAEGIDGLEVIRRIKSQWPQVRIVVLAMYATRRAAALAVRNRRLFAQGLSGARPAGCDRQSCASHRASLIRLTGSFGSALLREPSPRNPGNSHPVRTAPSE